MWLGRRRGHPVDWATQQWVRATGRRVDLQAEAWLDDPPGETSGIGADFFPRLAGRSGWRVGAPAPEEGLLADFSLLEGAEFDPVRLHPEVRRFYEHTAGYDLDAWSEWCGFFRPFGWLIAVLFSRRLQQLNLPISPLETSRGITSEVLPLHDAAGRRVATGWLRRRIATGSAIYVGLYSTARVPGFPGPCMKVAFPLPNGSAVVVMKPRHHDDGSLSLVSSGRGFGEPGFYFVVRRGKEAWARYLRAMREGIRVYVDDGGELRADHVLRLWGAVFLRFHYRMRRRPGA